MNSYNFYSLFTAVLFLALVMNSLTSCGEVMGKSSAKVEDFLDNQSVVTISGRTLMLGQFTNEMFSVNSFISPSCEHCRYQVQALLDSDEQKPESLSLCFLANVHPDTFKLFASQFEYDTASTVFVVDKNGELAQQMGVTSYPTMFLYDTAGVHLQTIVGEAKPGYVYKFFHEPH